MSEEWQQYKDEQKDRRQERLPIRQKEIEDLASLGYEVKKLTEYQYRVNDLYDLYPIHNRWHHLKTNKRGGSASLAQFITKNIKLNNDTITTT